MARPVTAKRSGYGQPSELTYKVLQATFRKLTEQGPDTDRSVLFSRRELATLVGKQSRVGSVSLVRWVNCTIHFKERVGDKWEKARWLTSRSSLP